VKPSLQVKNFNIASCSLDVLDDDIVPNRAGICLVVCEVMNPTARGFRLECSIIDDPQTQRHENNKIREIIIEPHCVKRIVLPLKRFTLDEPLLPPPRERKGQFVRSLIKYTPEQEREWRVLYWYKNEISKRIRVVWRSLVLNTAGELDLLHPMPLTREMVNRLNADIVNFAFDLHGVKEPASQTVDSNKNKSNIYYPTRQFKTIGFSVTNVTAKPVPLHIRIQPFQDMENGTKILNLGGKFAWIGSLEQAVQELQPDCTHRVNLTICFLAAGTFKFLVNCENVSSKMNNVSEVLRIEAF